MEKEITKTLELFNKGLEKMPETASKNWEQLVKGFQIESIFNFVMGIIFLILAAVLCAIIYKILISKKRPFYEIDKYGDKEITISGWFLLFFLIAASLIFVLMGLEGLFSFPAIFVPDYFLIKTLIFPK